MGEDARREPAAPRTDFRIHPAWIVAGVAFLALIGAAGFRAAPSVMIVPLQEEFGWSRSVLSLAVSINLVLYGLTAPFAAALMDRFGMRRVDDLRARAHRPGQRRHGAGDPVVAGAPDLGAHGRPGHRIDGARVRGHGHGSLVRAEAGPRQRHPDRGGRHGQLIFLPFLAILVSGPGWRAAALLVAAGALVVVPLVWLFLRDRPSDIGVTAYGADPTAPPPPRSRAVPARPAAPSMRSATRHARAHSGRSPGRSRSAA